MNRRGAGDFGQEHPGGPELGPARTILLVEDNPDDEILALRALRANRVTNEVVVVRDGVEALDYLKCRGPFAHRDPCNLPGLILLDLKLPRIDGLEVLRRIRAEEASALIPVVILTSSDEECDLASSYELGANSYVRKPVEFKQFVDAVGQLNLYWMLLNEAPPAV